METQKTKVSMATEQTPVIKSEMLIRKSVSEVFEAMVNPEITSKFWFTRGNGRVEAGKMEFKFKLNYNLP